MPNPTDTQQQAALGIAYTERFTLAQAVESFNATRAPIPSADGRVVEPEAQRLTFSDDWYARHAGEFVLRRPSLYDEIAMRVRTDALSGGRAEALSGLTRWLIEATAVAETLLIGKPDWFSLATLRDTDVLYLVHHWYTEWSARFRDGVS
jgi:hypothetical protein